MLWLPPIRPDGYARFKLNDRQVYAHRVSYTIAYGEIPTGFQVDHVKARGCTNRHCMAPDHLEAVTQAENIRRGDVGKAAAAIQRAKTHCPAGHEYSEANTYRRAGGRQCRTCHTERERAQRAGKAGPLAHIYDPAAKVPF